MQWRLPFVLSLIFLQGAAAPPAACPQDFLAAGTSPAAATLPGPLPRLDQAAAQFFPPGPAAAGNDPCRNTARTATRHEEVPPGESGDVLHGIPMPDMSWPISDPLTRPDSQ